ncbi:SpoIID/LytB domain-containing protein [Waterburya agarophytonicola K14]|uniref:SpoIID/LytB domain-containing protein n=1 Tax=Waterburya agarophytonicola KI4 TaxID=2874699 RepID=A0A964BNA4_9CYAN|nr:SpoIID/LytB domain-containing protein [Waterburya agarophytonicola]MCC0175761.1 SpoIID/LytB domain-containing protein [Waterburya agarophytonicola KI4]
MIKTTICLSVLWFGSLWGIPLTAAAEATTKEMELQIGIIQRLGAKPIQDEDAKIERVTISSVSGDSLKVSFLDPSQAFSPIETKEVVLKVDSTKLTQAKLQEKLILSDRSTFETAEDSANSWKKLGLEVEVAQPGRWQVWAKRDVYGTPLVRRWLLHSLEANGYDAPYLDTEILDQEPNIILEINGQEYNQDEVKITSSKNLVKVNTSNTPQAARIYGGSLKLQPNSYGEFSLVNHVPLETYLRGVVPYEIGANAPPQAVAAQTIIARTYALRNLRRFAVDDYQLCATVHCQVYKGLNDANATSDRAIAQTAGLVLTYENELIDALYSSTTGGITAGFEDTWNGAERPYLQPVIDAPKPFWDLVKYPLNNEKTFRHFISLERGFNETGRLGVFRWRKTRSIKALSQDLQKYLKKTRHPLADFKTIKSMEVHKRSRSGRILTLAIETDLGKLQLHKNEIRSALEPPRSTFFYLQPLYDESKQLNGYAFVGGGFGHGVGLSQYGSYNLAKLGWSAERILAFYYPQTTIKPLDETVVFWRDDFPPSISKN